MEQLKIGLAMTGSFCTFDRVLTALEGLGADFDITPVMSQNAAGTDTRFGSAADFRARLEKIAGRDIICTIPGAEPIGPQHMFDVLVIAPCTGNTLAKLANGITDTCVTMAAKSHLRNGRPVLLAVATNDGLSGSAKNIGELLVRKNIYFVPFRQDDAQNKPRSLAADYSRLREAIIAAAHGVQLQPILAAPEN